MHILSMEFNLLLACFGKKKKHTACLQNNHTWILYPAHFKLIL